MNNFLSMKDIVQTGAEVLRETATEVALADIPTPKIETILTEMREALDREPDGIAIAAPQIGYSLRIFLVSPKAFEEYVDQPLVYINPRITKKSKTVSEMPEGCLSVRWQYGNVTRHDKATVEAHNAEGKKFTWGGSGLIAQIFQHEIDHLDGKLFIDTATDLEQMSEGEIERYKKELGKQ